MYKELSQYYDDIFPAGEGQENFLHAAGFDDIEIFGGFNRKPHGWDSQSTVIQTVRSRSCKLNQ